MMAPETKEMLENAARAAIAAGLPIRWDDTYGWMQDIESMWRPDIIQGDSDRMGVALEIEHRYRSRGEWIDAQAYGSSVDGIRGYGAFVRYTDDRCADMRLARLMVADQIGRAMK